MPVRTSSHPQLQTLKEYYEQLKKKFHTTHGGASDWLRQQSLKVEDFRLKSQQILAVGSLAGTMGMHPGMNGLDQQALQRLHPPEEDKNHQLLAQITQEERQLILDKLKSMVLLPPGHLNSEDELYVTQQLSDLLGFSVTAELEGHRLNHSIGVMGGEQHLRRFPTDTLSSHDAYQESGIAPNRGAFGWFTENGELTEQAIQREKYYFAVQTMYLPDWNTNNAELKPWYKFRKMIAINPAEEMAVVGVVGDAGPAAWVKKQFGGSPEIIREGKIWSQNSRGRVILLFVDDEADAVPLGPINLKQLPPQLAAAETKA